MGGMAVTTTPRLELKKYGSGSDPHPSRAEFNAQQDKLESLVAVAAQGNLASRPSPGKWGRLYLATDSNRLYWDTGAAWVEVTNVGGGGNGQTIQVGGAGGEGTSNRAARADHTHTIPLATGTINGAMSNTDKAKLDGAVPTATASRMVVRDAAGRAQFADPAAAGDAATKGYVDGAVSSAAAASHTHPWDQVTGKPATFAPAAHRHPWADLDGVPATFAPAAHTHDAGAVTSGVFNAGRLPAASASTQGAMSAAHFNRVQGASAVATPGTLALLDAAGRTQFADPSAAADAATKNYVDGQIGTRAPASHTHPWSQITGAPAAFPPSAHTHTLAQITDAPSWLSMSVTTAPTGSTIVSRNSNGDFLVNTPTSGGMPASKSYVDGGLSSKSDATHEHASLVRSTGATFGIYSDDSVRLVDSDGVTRFRIAKSGGNGFLMNTVVDWDSLSGKPSTYSPSGHTHSGDDITSGEIPFARINGTRSVHSNTATNRSVWVTADGRFGQNTSSRRFKARERPWSGAGVLALEPVTYVRRDDDGNEPSPDAPRELGLIAEDVEPHLPEIVQYDPEGRVEALRYDLIPVALIPVVRDLVARVEELEAR